MDIYRITALVRRHCVGKPAYYVCAWQEPAEGDADPNRAHDPPPGVAAHPVLHPVLPPAIDAMRPAIASFLRHYIHTAMREEHLMRSIALVRPVDRAQRLCRAAGGRVVRTGRAEAHGAAAAEADADDPVAEAVEQVDVRRDALAGPVEVDDDLSRLWGAVGRREEQQVGMRKQDRAEHLCECTEEVFEEGWQAGGLGCSL